MTKEKEIPERVGTQGWEQFLATKQEILYQFDLAKMYAKSHIVQVSHGNVAEATFRRWLANFLPKKYGVTSGYIVSQNMEFKDSIFPHYDVIIYDQLNSLTLWIEENSDHSENGKTRAIPAEYVRAVLEIKSNLTEETSEKGIKKLMELQPLLKTPKDTEHFAGKLHSRFFTALVFFELQKENEFKHQILSNLIVPNSFPFIGGLVLKGEGRDINDTGRIMLLEGETARVSIADKTKQSLIYDSPISDSVPNLNNKHIGTTLMWGRSDFSFFAFDIIALLDGTYRSGILSSFYGLSWKNPKK